MSLDHQAQTGGCLLVQSCVMKMWLSLALVNLVLNNVEKLDQIQLVEFELVLMRAEIVVSAIDHNPCPTCH